MWGHVEDLVARARELPGLDGADLETVLHELLGDPQLIFVTRTDKVAQAVSLWRAVQTQSWRAERNSGEQPAAYDFDGVDHLVSQLKDDERAWREWFQRTAKPTIEVRYERLEAAPGETVATVLRELGLPDGGVTVPRLSRQRDELNSAWIERYRQERQAA
jgi:LPS sulfotransferase NodH